MGHTKNKKAACDILCQQMNYGMISTPTLQWLIKRNQELLMVLEGSYRYQAWITIMAATREILFRNYILRYQLMLHKVWEI